MWFSAKFSTINIEKAGRFEKLLGFARSHSIVTRDSVSLSCATTQHPSCQIKTTGATKKNLHIFFVAPNFPSYIFILWYIFVRIFWNNNGVRHSRLFFLIIFWFLQFFLFFRAQNQYLGIHTFWVPEWVFSLLYRSIHFLNHLVQYEILCCYWNFCLLDLS